MPGYATVVQPANVSDQYIQQLATEVQAEQRGGRKEVCVGRDFVQTERISRFNSSSVVRPHRL